MTKEKNTIDFNSEVEKIDFMYERMFWLGYNWEQADKKWNELKELSNKKIISNGKQNKFI